jgi:DNA-binding IclR family transcriptional regulator
LVAGLSISAPSGRLQDTWIPRLVETAGRISEALGYEASGA